MRKLNDRQKAAIGQKLIDAVGLTPSWAGYPSMGPEGLEYSLGNGNGFKNSLGIYEIVSEIMRERSAPPRNRKEG